MKNKLIAAMLVLSVQVNGTELDQTQDTSDNFCQFHIEIESKEDSSELDELVDQLEKYYQSESKESQVFEDLNSVFDRNERISFFENLISEYDNFTYDRAMLEFIRAAARTIIQSPQYRDELFDASDELFEDSPDYVYQPPFFYSLVEKLDPITRKYMKKVQENN